MNNANKILFFGSLGFITYYSYINFSNFTVWEIFENLLQGAGLVILSYFIATVATMILIMFSTNLMVDDLSKKDNWELFNKPKVDRQISYLTFIVLLPLYVYFG